MKLVTTIAALGLTITLAQSSGERPLSSLTGAHFTDLQFLRARLSAVRVVQLGEAGHGVGEISQLKSRLVHFLHRELGFTVLAFESSLYLAHQADMKAATAAPESTLTSSLIGVWHIREVLPVFDLIKSTRSSAQPLRLAGIDIQPIGNGKKTRPAFFRSLLAGVDDKYATEAEAFDAAFIAEYDKGSTSRRAFFRERRDSLIDGYTRLAAFLTANRSRIAQAAGREAVLVAAQEARSMVAYVRQQTAPDNKAYAEVRDEAMAENVRFLEELFPNQKIIVWAHNYHVAHATASAEPSPDVFPGVAARSMGSWTHERLRDRVYTMGIYPFEGRAVDNARKEYVIELPAEDSLESRLGAGGNAPAVVVDVVEAIRRGTNWLQSPVAARFEGRSSQKIVPADQYDAIVVVRRASPPVFLY